MNADEAKLTPARLGAAALPKVPGGMLGVYQLQAQLGEGATGIVYLAEHTRLGRKVALKLLRPELTRDVKVAERFLAEARAVNRVSSPHVVQITDIVEGDLSFYIMELLTGETLASRLAGGELPVEDGLRICREVAAGLCAVHDADIVHCDLKPENVFLHNGDGGKVIAKLIDFGIARLPGAKSSLVSAPGARGPRARDLVGTPAYMAPEQIENGTLSDATDTYAFGALLYHVLTGSPPFVADTVEDMTLKHLSMEPQRPSERSPKRGIGDALDTLVLHCLAKRPGDRPSSMNEVEFRSSRLGEGAKSTPFARVSRELLLRLSRLRPIPRRTQARLSRVPRDVWLSLAGILALLCIGVWALMPRSAPDAVADAVPDAAAPNAAKPSAATDAGASPADAPPPVAAEKRSVDSGGVEHAPGETPATAQKKRAKLKKTKSKHSTDPDRVKDPFKE